MRCTHCSSPTPACRELQQPNTNEDTLAPLLRDQLLPPLRRWWLNRVPGAWASLRRGLEHKRFGVPVCARSPSLHVCCECALRASARCVCAPTCVR